MQALEGERLMAEMENEYPKYLFHEDGRATIVADADAQKALGSGWHEKISDLGVESCPAAAPGTDVPSEVMPGFVAPRKQAAPPPPPAPASSAGRRGD